MIDKNTTERTDEQNARERKKNAPALDSTNFSKHSTDMSDNSIGTTSIFLINYVNKVFGCATNGWIHQHFSESQLQFVSFRQDSCANMYKFENEISNKIDGCHW